MTIKLYDISFSKPGIAWNPNTWKARYALNIKGIPYKTEWIEYPDIEPLTLKLGIRPTSRKADGSPYYTLPALYDPFTGSYVSDSLFIAKYLEKTYPDSPPLFPNNTLGLQTAFQTAFMSHISMLRGLSLPLVTQQLNQRSAEYFRRKTADEFVPKGEEAVWQWAKYKDGLRKVDLWYAQNGGKGPFLMGERPSWADVVVGSFTIWLKIVWGEDSQEWNDVKSWHGGRWNALVEGLKQYETVV